MGLCDWVIVIRCGGGGEVLFFVCGCLVGLIWLFDGCWLLVGWLVVD